MGANKQELDQVDGGGPTAKAGKDGALDDKGLDPFDQAKDDTLPVDFLPKEYGPHIKQL